MLIAECVFLHGFQHDVEVRFPDHPPVFNFDDKMKEAFEYGIREFADDFMFQLRVGRLLRFGAEWFCDGELTYFMAADIMLRLLSRAYALKPTSATAKYLYASAAKTVNDLYCFAGRKPTGETTKYLYDSAMEQEGPDEYMRCPERNRERDKRVRSW